MIIREKHSDLNPIQLLDPQADQKRIRNLVIGILTTLALSGLIASMIGVVLIYKSFNCDLFGGA